MIQTDVIRISAGSAKELLEKLEKIVARDGLLGLERKPGEDGETTPNRGRAAPYKWEPNTLCAKAHDESTILTIRRDLVSLREKVLHGVRRVAVLRELDSTLDQLDNALAEM